MALSTITGGPIRAGPVTFYGGFKGQENNFGTKQNHDKDVSSSKIKIVDKYVTD